MTGSAISTTGRRSIHPAVQSISLETQPTALSRALPIPHLLGILSTPRHRICVQGGGRAAGHGVSSVDYRIAMIGGAIPTTRRRSTRPGNLSRVVAQPAPLRCALTLRVGPHWVWPTSHLHGNEY
jgi:hypothetical protein